MSTAPIAAAVEVIRANSLLKRNGLSANHVAVDRAWKVIVLAARDLDPKITRRDQALVVLGVTGKSIFG